MPGALKNEAVEKTKVFSQPHAQLDKISFQML